MNAPLLSFEGIDNCGKTTQIKLLTAYLGKKGVPYIIAQEPGGTTLGGALRRVLKNPEEVYAALNEAFREHPDFTPLQPEQKRTAEAEMLLFLAARAEFMHHVVKPALQAGKLVIADRFADSTRAYQGGGRFQSAPESIDLINRINNFVLQGRWPDKTFLLDLSYAEMLKRAEGTKLDYIERSGPEFFERVIAEYKTIAREHPTRVVCIEATRPKEVIFNDHIRPMLEKLLTG